MKPPPELLTDVEQDRWWLAEADKKLHRAKNRRIVSILFCIVLIGSVIFINRIILFDGSAKGIAKCLGIVAFPALFVWWYERARVTGARKHLVICKEALIESELQANLSSTHDL